MSVLSAKETNIPVLTSREWLELKKIHESEVDELLDEYLAQRSKHIKNPVMDFLFEYYSFRPAQLKRWSPGFGTAIEYNTYEELPEISELSIQKGLAYLSVEKFPSNRVSSLHWILKLLVQSQQSNPSFGCFGMHEWAMLYKTETPRHSHIPLRIDKTELAKFVESMPLLCTHFDAYRFFTPDARPMNHFSLSREKFIQTEQPGCIHNNMDLYKWAFKMHPWSPSSLILSAFKFALEARIIDMKASPYDLTKYGYEPIKIETEEGRRKYQQEQKRIWEKGNKIRKKLIRFYEELTNAVSNKTNTYTSTS